MIKLAKPQITEEMKKAVQEVLESGVFVNGARTERFEKEFAGYCGVRHAVGVGSGTDALHLAVLALGIGKGDEVIVPANTFVSTAFAVKYAGARVVYADIDETYNIDAKDAGKKITGKTKAIIPVHMYGQSCDMDEIMGIAQEKGLRVIEDACQAHGAGYKGKKAGSIGDIGCFSFYPSKNMTVAGEGGMAVTNDKGISEKIRELSNYGQTKKNLHTSMGYNSRLSEISAAIGIEQLKHLDGWNKRRKEIAKEYSKKLEGVVETPAEKNDHVYHLYVIRAEERDRLRAGLEKKGIETGVHYPLPVYKQPCMLEDVKCEKAEEYAGKIISMPMHPGLGQEEIEKVVEGIKECTKAKK